MLGNRLESPGANARPHGGKAPSEQAVKARGEQLKQTIRQSLETHGIAVEFGSLVEQ